MSGDGIGVGPEPEEEFTDGLNPQGSGKGGRIEKNDDVSQETRSTLGDFISSITHDTQYGNTFPLEPGSTDAAIQTEDGKPAALNFDGSGAERQFAEHTDDNGLRRYSDSNIGNDLPILSNVVKKGKSQAGPLAEDGHELLPGVERVAGDGFNRDGSLPNPEAGQPIGPVGRTSRILAANRFNLQGAFDAVAQKRGNDGGHLSTRQKQFGVYDPLAEEVTVEQMRKIGKSLSLRSTGEFAARGRGDNPESAIVQNRSLLPGEAQLAVTKIGTLDLEARQVFEELFGEEIGATLESESRQGRGSFGNLTNCVEHFDSLAPAGMIALAVALVLAAQVAIKALLAVISLITGGKTGRSDLIGTDPLGRPIPGDYRIKDKSDDGLLGAVALSPAALGLQPVNFEFNRAVNAGLAVFVGAPVGSGIGTQLLSSVNPFGSSSFSRVVDSPGYYAVFIRNIARGLNQIAGSVKNISIGRNIARSISSVSNVVDTIRRSPVISALNIFAVLGEKVLILQSQGFDVNKLGKEGRNRVSKLDLLPDGPATNAMKSRASDRLALSWRTSATTSQLLLPTVPLAAITAVGTNENNLSTPVAYSSMEKSSAGASKINFSTRRIDAETTHNIEALLDAEYMPFYFHDIRTNEIVSFHAFLESISDEYSANYEPTTAYGRVDDVQTYKNTNRTISLSFWCAATNDADLDELYVKINKLTTLVYPQYTAGTQLEDENGNKFLQPFSQVIGGSPLARIRLGDIFRTNYSRGNLARLFGAGSDAFEIDGESVSAEDTKIVDSSRAVSAMRRALQEGIIGDLQTLVFKLRPNGNLAAAQQTDGYAPSLQSGLDIGGALASSVGIPSGDPLPNLVISHPVKVQVIGAANSKELGTDKSKLVVEVLDEDLRSVTDESSSRYEVNFTDLILDDESIQLNLSEGGILNNEELLASVESIQNFFDPESNVIVRQFEDAGGKGLAGFITSLTFDWNAAEVWETSRFGARAPKVFQVNVGFTPIHDIPPGIDFTGFNRGPLYNVGSAINSIAGDGPEQDNKGRDAFNSSHGIIEKKANERKGT